jgi:prolyl oligopeptidase
VVRWQGRQHDVRGALAAHTNAWWRNCSAVARLHESSAQAQQVLRLIAQHSPPDSTPLQLVHLLQQGDWLVAEGLAANERLGLFGGSNGGLLVGAALTQRPAMARAVWCAVPLLDMVRFPQFLIARLWTDEYGDPDHPDEFGWIHAYSPDHHVDEGTAYPAVLFTTAEGDTRVDPCHARKMAAALTWASSAQDERPILLAQAGRAGHGVGKPAAMRVNEGADVLSFFSWQLGLE